MLLGGYREFTVLYFTSSFVHGCKFALREGAWVAVGYGTQNLNPDNPGENWKNLLKEIGSTSTELVIVSGSLAGGIFFQMNSLPLSAKEQRGVVSMELPRKILQSPKDPEFQFIESPIEDKSLLNVYVFSHSNLELLTNHLIALGIKADEFCYPLLGLKADDHEVFIADLEENYYFHRGSWHAIAGETATLNEAAKWWDNTLRKEFSLPSDPNFTKQFMGVLLCARLAKTNLVVSQRANLRVLPEKLRPVRYRPHLAISALLLILLIASMLYQVNRTSGADYREYRKLVSETRSLQSRADSMLKRIRKQTKEHKELLRVTELYNDTPNVLSDLALLSKTLPHNVMINRLRLSDSNWDLTMQSEDGRLNLPSLINPLGIWKIEQLQQRQFGDSGVATISFKLTPLKAAVPEKKRK